MPHQPELLTDATAPQPAAASSPDNLALTTLKFSADQMSPAQKIDSTRTLADTHRRVCASTLAPLEKEREGAMGQMVR